MAKQAAPAIDQISPAVRSQSLDGQWKLSYGPIKSMEMFKQDLKAPPADFQTIPATVPGDTGLDLVAAGIVKDPLVGRNVYELLKYENYQWWYRRSFPSPRLQNGERAELIFDGLDCLGTVWMNGKLLGRTANMFIPHRFDVTSQLSPAGSENEVLVRIDPALLGGREQRYPGEWHLAGHWSHLAIRKSGVRYGWDMAPRVIGAGLWQGVRLEMTQPTHLRSSYWTTKVVNVPEKNCASVIVDWDIETDRVDIYPLKIKVELSRNGKAALQREFQVMETHGQQCMDNIKNVELWWPRGFGEQALYDAKITLVDADGTVLDEKKDRIGIRSIQLLHSDTTSKENPGHFFFMVNGQKVFIKGANWGYLDIFPSRESKRVDEVVKLLAESNANMIRLNGVGTYGSDRFYQLCDEYGVMVWQDFMLGNERVPQTEEFRKVMAEEAAAAITRIRNHPSLALWCGGNEADYDYYVRDGLDPATDTITREVFPSALQRYDFGRVRNNYLPGTPYIGPELVRKGLQYLPERHLYLFNPPFYFKNEFFTTNVIAPFASEIGWLSIPNRESLEQMFTPEALQPWTKDHKWNPEWMTKGSAMFPTSDGQGHYNGLMGEVNSVFSDIPENLDDLILATQAAHGEALKFWIDSWRIRKWDRSGILFWSFHDGWPLVSFGVVDYYNRKKISFDYVQASQRNVQAICGEAENGQHPVVIVNDTLQPVQGSIVVKRVGGDSATLLDSKFEVASNGKASLGFIPDPTETEMWQLEWKLQDGQVFKTHYLAAKGKVRFADYVAWMKQLGLRMK